MNDRVADYSVCFEMLRRPYSIVIVINVDIHLFHKLITDNSI